MIVNYANSWGSHEFSEAQRQDLWYIDFKPVLDLILRPKGVVTQPKFDDLVAQTYGFDPTTFSIRCTLPEETLDGKMVMSGSQNRYLPGVDSPPGPMRVDFYHEAASRSAALTSSAAWCMLKAWQLLSTAGQSLEGGVNPYLLLENEASKPSYKVSLRVTFLRGVTLKEFKAGVSLAESAVYAADNCWLSDLQFNELSMSENGTPLEFSATILPSKIYPLI